LFPDPPFYFPLRHGRYDVAPGLSRFGKELGGGEADTKVFQFDKTFPRFRAAKIESHREHHDCVVSSNLHIAVARRVARFIIDRLAAEHPDLFSLAPEGHLLRCRMTGDELLSDRSADAEALLVAIGHQLQEDFAIVSTASDTAPEWLSFAHVCLPNGWAPGEKIGRSFAAIHEPVAGMAEMNRRGQEFAELMTRATDGLVRFAWGVTFDNALDHHPARPRVAFDLAKPRAFLRVERQTIWGFPDVSAAMFTIRTYLYDVDALRRNPATRDPLLAALRTMPVESVAYKGLGPHLDHLIAWIGGAAR
jgi:hypothetical protein